MGLLTIAPALFLILALTLYPVAYSIWLSLLEKHSFFPQERFIGLKNYLYLWTDPEFWTSLWLGMVYSIWTILFQVILGVAAAFILNESFVGRGLVRGIVRTSPLASSFFSASRITVRLTPSLEMRSISTRRSLGLN
jgi:multiple sugar transport system permease protein